MRTHTLVLTLALGLVGCGEASPPVTPHQPPAPPATAVTRAAPEPAAPADPAAVTDGDVTLAYANGVQILVKRIPGAELSAMQLYIKGGAREWTAADAGITRLSLAVATSGGTKALDKDAFDRRLAGLGSQVYSESGNDFAAIKGKALIAHWDETFDLLADAFLRPALPASELELRREQQISSIRREKDSPDASLSKNVNLTIFKGHPFENRPIGTEASVSALTLDAVKAHLGKLRESGRLLFVTAGDVDPAHVVEKVKAAFGDLPRGASKNEPFAPIAFAKPTLWITDRKLSTNYIEGAFPAPGWSSEEFPEAVVAMDLLRYNLFEEVRTKRNLSYAPGCGLASGSSVPFGYLYVTAVEPDKTIKVMFDAVRKLQNERVADDVLTAAKSVYLTTFLMTNEATDGQAGMLASAQLLGGDFRLARTLPERVRAVTPERVQAFAKKYLRRLQMVVLGDPVKFDQSLFLSL